MKWTRWDTIRRIVAKYGWIFAIPIGLLISIGALLCNWWGLTMIGMALAIVIFMLVVCKKTDWRGDLYYRN